MLNGSMVDAIEPFLRALIERHNDAELHSADILTRGVDTVTARFRFFAELNNFLPQERRQR
jgi:hypothetical protein